MFITDRPAQRRDLYKTNVLSLNKKYGYLKLLVTFESFNINATHDEIPSLDLYVLKI